LSDSEAVRHVREWVQTLGTPGRDLAQVHVWGGLTGADLAGLLADRDGLHKCINELRQLAAQYASEIASLRAARGED